MNRYSFSGHETFPCKALWLKKGYDFLSANRNFNDNDAVVHLGVGKNMVTSIRFWMKAFGLIQADKLTPFADFFFSDKIGRDPYLEDTNSLWILHYSLVKQQVASLYHLLFLGFQRELKTFDREQVNAFVKRKCSTPEQSNVYNENTVKKDIGVLLATYVMPSTTKMLDEYNALLLDLGLIRILDKRYVFNQTEPSQISPAVILFALLDYCPDDKTISFDKLQEIALIFGLSLADLIVMLERLAAQYPEQFIYTDNAGVRNVQFIGPEMNKYDILDTYYKK